MNLLTQLTIGEIKEFLNSLNDDVSLVPCWGSPAPAQEDPTRVSLYQGNRGSVRTLKTTIRKILAEEINGQRYGLDTLVDVRYPPGYLDDGTIEGSMTLGMMIASIRYWRDIGE